MLGALGEMSWTGDGENAEQVPSVKGGLWGQEDAGPPQAEAYPLASLQKLGSAVPPGEAGLTHSSSFKATLHKVPQCMEGEEWTVSYRGQ